MAADPNRPPPAALDVKFDQNPFYIAFDARKDWYLSPASASAVFIVVGIDRPGVRAASASCKARVQAIIDARLLGYDIFLRCDDLHAYLVGGIRVFECRESGVTPSAHEIAVLDAAVAQQSLDDGLFYPHGAHRAYIMDRYPLPADWHLEVSLP